MTEAAGAELLGRDAYRALFDTIDDGFAVMEAVRGEDGRVADVIYREVNQAWKAQTGVTEPLGRRASELFTPIDPAAVARWNEVLETGRSVRDDNAAGGRWYTVHYTRIGGPGSELIGAVFADITARRAAGDRLRESEERQAFLLRLSDALRPLDETDAITATATRLLGEQLGASRAYYAEWPDGADYALVTDDYAVPGQASLAGRYPKDMFRSAYDHTASGRTWVVNDAAADETIAAAERQYYVEQGVVAWVDVPLIKRGQLQSVLCVVQNARRTWTHAEIAIAEETAERCWAAIERARAELVSRDNAERLRLIVENARDYAIFTMDLDGRVTDWREGAQAVFGYTSEEIVGRSADILYTPEDNHNGELEKERALAARTGKSPNVRWHVCKDSSLVFIEGVCTALHDADGQPAGFLKVGRDASERHASEERQKLLLAELQHRVRNILGMVRSLVRQSSEGQADVGDYVNHLMGRLDALSRTQVLLTRAAGATVDLETLVQDELLAHVADERRLKVDGPPVTLSPRAAEVLTMALHELATNSIKYGVLAQGGGQLSVEWSAHVRNQKPWLSLEWRETGRIPGVRPVRRGFGTELIEERVPYELKGEASIEVGASDMRAVITFPLNEGTSVLETRPVQAMEA